MDIISSQQRFKGAFCQGVKRLKFRIKTRILGQFRGNQRRDIPRSALHQIAERDIRQLVDCEIEARIQALVYLEDMLDGDQLYFKYDPRKKAFSRIEADYLVSGKANNTPVYLFLGSRSDDTYYCRSFFPQERVDYYAEGLPKYTLLRKVKINQADGTRTVQFDRFSE